MIKISNNLRAKKVVLLFYYLWDTFDIDETI